MSCGVVIVWQGTKRCGMINMLYSGVGMAWLGMVYTRKNAQVVTSLQTSCQQVVFARLVPSLL